MIDFMQKLSRAINLHVPGHEIKDPGLGVVVQAGNLLRLQVDGQVLGLHFESLKNKFVKLN